MGTTTDSVGNGFKRSADPVVGGVAGGGGSGRHLLARGAHPGGIGGPPGGAEVSAAAADAAKALVPLLRGAKRGLLVAGSLPRAADREAVAQLAAWLRWPLYADLTSGLRLGGSGGAVVLGPLDQLLHSPIVSRGLAPDVIIQFGTRLVSKRAASLLVDGGARAHALVAPGCARFDPDHSLTLRVGVSPADAVRALDAALAAGSTAHGNGNGSGSSSHGDCDGSGNGYSGSSDGSSNGTGSYINGYSSGYNGNGYCSGCSPSALLGVSSLCAEVEAALEEEMLAAARERYNANNNANNTTSNNANNNAGNNASNNANSNASNTTSNSVSNNANNNASNDKAHSDLSDGPLGEETLPLSEPLLARRLLQLLPSGDGFFIGNSMPIRDSDMFGPSRNSPTESIGPSHESPTESMSDTTAKGGLGGGSGDEGARGGGGGMGDDALRGGDGADGSEAGFAQQQKQQQPTFVAANRGASDCD
ncbi:hypothetical protein T492DRAFT_832021 [Pavlovales sp. CCMP2436]|nr:hypothetical protein T492DRAFT_832021 [Pavlovales sp. CCMP2436]